MSKHTLEMKAVRNLIFPYLPVLVGVNVHGKPNYITIGLIGWLCYDMISISVGHQQYSIGGLSENRTFSINQPGRELLEKLDYCGIASGRTADKAAVFETFYGKLETAPMIRECPINIECRVVQTLYRPIHQVFLGEVAAIHASEDALSHGLPDVEKIRPVFYAPEGSGEKPKYVYWGLGAKLGDAFAVGRKLMDE